MYKRIYNLNMKMNATEKDELSRLMHEQQKSASDIIRMAIKNTFDCEGFERNKVSINENIEYEEQRNAHCIA